MGDGELAGVGDLVPAPARNVTKIPRIRSGRPAFGLRCPHVQTGRTRRLVPPVSTRPSA